MQRRLRYRFPVYGTQVPVDHGEALYGAVSGVLPELHQLEEFLLSPIVQADALGDRLILKPGSCFYAYVPEDYVPALVSLSGKSLRLRDSMVRVGPVGLHLIQPSPTVHSRMVTFKNAVTEDQMEGKVREALDEMGVKAEIKVLRRRVITIHGRKVIGFGVQVSGLSDEDSVAVQVNPVGGRRRFGCGSFFPIWEGADR
ncbi:MAG: type I-MYXAN CRISPR-associated protein Cas6/Cmx6 [Alicyclobacillus sp.]|nr:type I-MYXAN CRISPR-associated protein Cas6/Cmx6 [Alicyclobacillus sp.]